MRIIDNINDLLKSKQDEMVNFLNQHMSPEERNRIGGSIWLIMPSAGDVAKIQLDLLSSLNSSIEELKQFVMDLPPDGWRKGGKEKFIECGVDMLNSGMSVRKIKEILTKMFSAVAAEYGE